MTNKTSAAVEATTNFSAELTEWDDTPVRQLVDTVKHWNLHWEGKEVEFKLRNKDADRENGILAHTITNERLAAAGYFCIPDYCESLHRFD